MLTEQTELLTGKTIRETLKSDDGRALVVLNIAYPACAEQKPSRPRLLSGKRKKNVPLQETLDPFYERAAAGFDGRDAYPIPPDVRVWDKKTGSLREKNA